MSTQVEHQPVVVGIDGSPTMFLAVAWAVDYAGSLSAPLRIVVVYHPDALEDEVLAAGAPTDQFTTARIAPRSSACRRGSRSR